MDEKEKEQARRTFQDKYRKHNSDHWTLVEIFNEYIGRFHLTVFKMICYPIYYFYC